MSGTSEGARKAWDARGRAQRGGGSDAVQSRQDYAIADRKAREAIDADRKVRDAQDAFLKELGIKEMQVTPNSTWSYIDTPKGQAGIYFNQSFGSPLEIHWLTAQARGSGRAAMELVTKLADKHGVELKLYAVPLAGQGDNEGFTPSRAQLERFYEGFGFKIVSREAGSRLAKMVRKPKKRRG